MAETKNGMSNTVGEKQVYFEVLRALATFAVVFLHIVMTLVANYSVDEIGASNYAIFNGCYMLVKWAVPCFIMITGALLLNPLKTVDYSKIKGYVTRMLLILCTFGVVYSLMELVFSSHSFQIGYLLKAVLLTAEGKSWNHMWYVYLLIGLYLATLPLRYVVNQCSEKELKALFLLLIVGNCVIPTINSVFGIKLENFMLISEYCTYYIAGYYYSTLNKRFKYYQLILVSVLSVAVMIGTEVYSIMVNNTSYPMNHQATDIFTFLLSSAVFLLVKEICEDKKAKMTNVVKVVGKYSFAIYLIHPFFINLIYKVIGFTPLSINIWIGILVLYCVVAGLSFFAAVMIKKVPFIKKIV